MRISEVKINKMSFVKKQMIKEVARNYNLKEKRKEKFFDDLWEFYQIGNKFRRKNKDKAEEALQENYRFLAAAILNQKSKNTVFKRVRTFPLKEEISPKPPTKFVIFSDHHMTPKEHSHNYFWKGKNKSLYKEVLKYYSDNDFGLIENGDIEEYVIFEPTAKVNEGIVERYKKLIQKGSFLGIKEDIGEIEWVDLLEERAINRRNILEQILDDHSDLYRIVEERFAKKGLGYYTRITGNHDPYTTLDDQDLNPDPTFKRLKELDADIISLLNDRYPHIRQNLFDAVRINNKDSNGIVIDEPKYFITHGHQFDAATLPQLAFGIGEVISETLGWFIEGPDKMWTEEKTEQWRNPSLISSFRNILAHGEIDINFAPDAINAIGEWLTEELLQGHEVAWEYFDNQSKIKAVTKELITGDEYCKVRHLSETELVAKLTSMQENDPALSSFRKPTKLIIGHTHEPRLKSKESVNNQRIISNFINCGSAGRFENLIWGIELVDGKEKLISWTNTGTKKNVKLHRNEWIPTGDGQLKKKEYPLVGHNQSIII